MVTPAMVGITSSAEVLGGGCAVWALPHTRECAETARARLRDTLSELLPEHLDDCLEMAGELATNAWLHGLGGKDLDDRYAPAAGRSELAVYRRGQAPGAELVVTVFDPKPDVDAIVPGSGLDRVGGLANGRHGFYRTRSRLGAHAVPGKAAWFAVPLPPSSLIAQPPQVSLSPAQAVQALRSRLEARGLGLMYHNDIGGQSVLSLRHLTVWCRAQTFEWGAPDNAIRHPFFDLTEAVEQVVRINEDHEYALLGTAV
jgi:hypothetical protein